MDKQRLRQMFEEVIDASKSNDEDSRILIVDGLNMFIRIWAAVPAINEDGVHVGGILGFLKSLGSVIRQFNPTKCVVVFDGSGGSQRRRKVYSDYKENRRTKIQLNRFDEFDGLQDEQESMKLQFQRLMEYLRTLPITVFAIDNIEADDTIAYLCTEYFTKPQTNITIVSTDKDFFQLVDDRIQVWNPVKKKLFDSETVQQVLQVTPHNYLTLRAITGDPSDNITGVKGLGLKTIGKLIPEIYSEPLTVDQLIQYAKDRQGVSKTLTKIVEGEEVIKRNYSIMQLTEANISGHSAITILDYVQSPTPRLDWYQFKAMYAEDKMHSAKLDIHNWLVSTFNNLNLHGKS